MSQPKIEILGAYKLEFTDQQIKQLIEDSFGDVLDKNQKQEMFTSKHEELASVVAFDVKVTNANEKFDVGDFTQPDSDQVAYNEAYLSPDGRSLDSTLKPTDPINFRIYFFLHFTNVNKPLLSSYGELSIPELKPLPEYLNRIHPFVPVD